MFNKETIVTYATVPCTPPRPRGFKAALTISADSSLMLWPFYFHPRDNLNFHLSPVQEMVRALQPRAQVTKGTFAKNKFQK